MKMYHYQPNQDLKYHAFFNGYEYVDLGLPSGTLWAISPITNINNEVLYFQWGDTEGWTETQIQNGEKQFNRQNYKWNNDLLMTKYNPTDGKTVLDLEDDAVHVHMGGNWHMPTKEQLEELTANTTSTWITQNGVNGRLFTSNTNGNSLFVPTFRFILDGYIALLGPTTLSWSSSLYDSNSNNAYYLNGNNNASNVNYNSRYCGLPLHGVVG